MPQTKKVPLVLYRYQGHSYAYIVDTFIGHQELVIKETPKVLKRSREILGVSVLGDGRAVIVLDLIQMVNCNTKKNDTTRGGYNAA